jgi:hypothetical protein
MSGVVSASAFPGRQSGDSSPSGTEIALGPSSYAGRGHPSHPHTEDAARGRRQDAGLGSRGNGRPTDGRVAVSAAGGPSPKDLSRPADGTAEAAVVRRTD